MEQRLGTRREAPGMASIWPGQCRGGGAARRSSGPDAEPRRARTAAWRCGALREEVRRRVERCGWGSSAGPGRGWNRGGGGRRGDAVRDARCSRRKTERNCRARWLWLGAAAAGAATSGRALNAGEESEQGRWLPQAAGVASERGKRTDEMKTRRSRESGKQRGQEGRRCSKLGQFSLRHSQRKMTHARKIARDKDTDKTRLDFAQ